MNLMLDNYWLNSECVMATIQKSFNYTEFREIRCQFIILARKDEPTPDYA